MNDVFKPSRTPASQCSVFASMVHFGSEERTLQQWYATRTPRKQSLTTLMMWINRDWRGWPRVGAAFLCQAKTKSIIYMSEPGLYSLIIRSHKAEAKPFKKWVCSDVLPSIKETGSCAPPPAITSMFQKAEHKPLFFNVFRRRSPCQGGRL